MLISVWKLKYVLVYINNKLAFQQNKIHNAYDILIIPYGFFQYTHIFIDLATSFTSFGFVHIAKLVDIVWSDYGNCSSPKQIPWDLIQGQSWSIYLCVMDKTGNKIVMCMYIM